MSELHDVDRRLALFEQIAGNTAAVLADIRTEIHALRTDLRADIGGFAGLLAVVAHGFH